MARPSKTTRETLTRVVESLLAGDDLEEAVATASISRRTVEKYAIANPWYRDLIEAARGRADREAVIRSMAAVFRWIDGGAVGPCPEIVAPPPPEPPGPRCPAPKIPPPHRELPPAPERSAPVPPAPVSAARLDSDADVLPRLGVHEIDPGASEVSEVFVVDVDLVVDQDDDLRRVGLPTTHEIAMHLVAVAKDKSHPACSVANGWLGKVALGALSAAQRARDAAAIRRAARVLPVVDVEQDEGQPNTGLVIVRYPAKDPIL